MPVWTDNDTRLTMTQTLTLTTCTVALYSSHKSKLTTKMHQNEYGDQGDENASEKNMYSKTATVHQPANTVTCLGQPWR